MSRIKATFDRLKAEARTAFIPFIMAGDPDLETSLEIMKGLPAAGADLIELGVAFTDPMADGPSIQAAGLRALNAGQTLRKTLAMAATFRTEDQTTPIVLMGYYNPIHHFGEADFVAAAAEAGVDGLIVVDLPPEEDGPLRALAAAAGIDLIRLATPTTDDDRIGRVLEGASGFIYYVAVAGVTGRASADIAAAAAAVTRLQNAAKLPIALGFGVKTPEQAAQFAGFCDAVVVGSAIVDEIAGISSSKRVDIAAPLERGAADTDNSVHGVLSFARDIAAAVHAAK